MILRTYPSAAPFLACVQPVLGQNEVMHNLLLGLGQRLAAQPDYFNSTPFFVTVEVDETAGSDALLLAGLRTPPYNLILGSESSAYAGALPLLVENLLKEQSDLPGV